MTPLRARLVGFAHTLHCWVGDHARVTEVTVAADGERSTTLRQRCIYCRHVTPGFTQAEKPGYHYSPGMERPDPRLVMHNPRLGKRCLCVGCETRRRAQRQKRVTVAPIRRSA